MERNLSAAEQDFADALNTLLEVRTPYTVLELFVNILREAEEQSRARMDNLGDVINHITLP